MLYLLLIDCQYFVLKKKDKRNNVIKKQNLNIKFQKFCWWVPIKFHENLQFSKIREKFLENSRFSR